MSLKTALASSLKHFRTSTTSSSQQTDLEVGRTGKNKAVGISTTQRLERAEAFELYKIGVDEYRFQVLLNWRRSQYFLVFNLGILVAAVGLTRFVSGPAQAISVVLHVIGVLCCLVSLAAGRSQDVYYKNSRLQVKRLERSLNIEPYGIVTTPRLSGESRKFGKVKTFIRLLLVSMATLNLLGIGILAYTVLRGVDPVPTQISPGIVSTVPATATP